MISKEAIIEKAHALEFVDIGFTTAEPFEKQREILQDRSEEYGWVHRMGLDLTAGTDPENILPGARSIIVLLEAYFSKSFPTRMERHFGRCYLDDDRVTKDGLALRIKQFRAFLKDAGMEVKVLSVSYPPNEQALVWQVAASQSGAARVRISYIPGTSRRASTTGPWRRTTRRR